MLQARATVRGPSSYPEVAGALDVPSDPRYILADQASLVEFPMRGAVQATEAKAYLAGRPRTVERGETVTGVRHGRAIAHMTPARAGEGADRKQAVARFRRRDEWCPGAMFVDDILTRAPSRPSLMSFFCTDVSSTVAWPC